MHKYLFFLLGWFISTSLLAQSEFVRGQYTDKDNNTKECYVKVEKWNYIPSRFYIKANENSEEVKLSSEDINELIIERIAKFKLVEAEIDNKYVTPHTAKLVRNNKILVKVLVEGKASLYQAEYNDGVLFWYSLNEGKLNLLKYRTYQNANGKEMEDYSYKSQIQADIKCDDVSLKDILSLKYTSKALTEYFTNYNKYCTSEDPDTYFQHAPSSTQKFSFSPFVGMSNYTMTRPTGKWDDEAMTVNGSGFLFGIDMELGVGKKNTWAIVSQMHFYSSDKRWDISDQFKTIEGRLRYQTFRLPAGIRYKQRITDQFGLYVDVNYSLDLAINSYVAKYTDYNDVLYSEKSKIKPTALAFVGFGASYNKLKIGCLFEPKRNILSMSELNSDPTDYSAWSITLAYKLF